MKKYVFHASAEDFKKIPGSPIAYWVGEKMVKAFEGDRLGDVILPRHGLATSDNARFLRLWHEISSEKASLIIRNDLTKKWFPMNKGGSYRKWYGNNEWVINYENNGREIKDFAIQLYRSSSRTIQNTQFYFKPCITWSALTSGDLSLRWSDEGAIFGSGAHCAFADDHDLKYGLALMNSGLLKAFMELLAPTLNINVDHLRAVPYVVRNKTHIETNAISLISLSRSDWDEYETSWDFKVNPLVREGWQRNGAAMSIEAAWAAVFARRMEWTERMKALEEENNRLFIDTYGLQDELSPDVAWKDVSITGNPAYRYKLDGDPQSGEELAKADAMRELISYGMGVLMGRYSLEQEGLILASQGELYKDYIARVHGAGKILPDEDGVIPAIALEGGFFKDNLLHRMREFLSAAFGNDALPANLNFIEAALGCGFDKYLTEKFFDDHVKTYKKRPIYWLFESPKGYFRAFTYMHRMTGATAGHIRNNYLLPYIVHLEKCFAAEAARGSGMTSAERKRVKAMEAAIKDCKAYDLVLHDFADRAVAIDLDDGVVVNWGKYKEVLAKL